jgi:hypothetical protein
MISHLLATFDAGEQTRHKVGAIAIKLHSAQTFAALLRQAVSAGT